MRSRPKCSLKGKRRAGITSQAIEHRRDHILDVTPDVGIALYAMLRPGTHRDGVVF